MRYVAAAFVFMLCSCSSDREQFSVPIRFGEVESRLLSVNEFSKVGIEYVEKDGLVYVRKRDFELALAITKRISEQNLPPERSFSPSPEKYALVKDYMLENKIDFKEVESSGMKFFVFKDAGAMQSVDDYMMILAERELTDREQNSATQGEVR